MCVCIDPLCSPFSMLFVPCDQNHSVSKRAHLLYVIDNEGIGSVLWEGRHRKQRAKRWPSDVQGATESISEVVVWRPIWQREKCVHGHYGEICPWSLRWSGPRHRLFANNRLASQLFQCCLTPEGYIYTWPSVSHYITQHTVHTTLCSAGYWFIVFIKSCYVNIQMLRAVKSITPNSWELPYDAQTTMNLCQASLFALIILYKLVVPVFKSNLDTLKWNCS